MSTTANHCAGDLNKSGIGITAFFDNDFEHVYQQQLLEVIKLLNFARQIGHSLRLYSGAQPQDTKGLAVQYTVCNVLKVTHHHKSRAGTRDVTVRL